MKTKDEISKMRAVVLYVLQYFKEGVDYIKLFKILYFAQKEHIVRYGRGVMCDTFHALKYGPVPSFIYKSLQALEERVEQTADIKEFCQGISLINPSLIISSASPDMDELSVSDMKCLDMSISQYKDMDSFQLSRLSHDAAWKKAFGRSQNDPEKDRMTLIDIAKAGNALPGMIEYIKENIQLDKYLN